jgi:hypothetical protein
LWSEYGVFSKRILETEYDFDYTFFKNKSYFIQLFLNNHILFNFF